jgi:predicted ArsR family transcriptional regulator
MDDGPGPDDFTDINEAVGADWEAETTPYERVREVISRQYAAVSADAVADTARTSPKTARKYLEALADEGYVATEAGEHGSTRYRRSPESLVVEQAADILDRVSVDELVDRITEMRERIDRFRERYDAESPEALTADRTNGLLSEDESRAAELDSDELREWQTTRRNLAFANAALSIATAERFVGDDSTRPGESAPVQ